MKTWKAAARAVALSLAFAGPIRAQSEAAIAVPAEIAAPAIGLAAFDEAWRLVKAEFYDPKLNGLDWNAMRDRYRPLVAAAADAEERSAIINRMLGELNASHTAHYTDATPAYYQLADIFAGGLRRDLRRAFPNGDIAYPGIGIWTKEIEGRTFVAGLWAGFPAERAGLKVGDEITGAGGGAYHPIKSFTGKVGETVTLDIQRHRDGPIESVAVKPVVIKPNDAFLKAMAQSVRIIESDGKRIGYIRVWNYAGAQYQRQLEKELASERFKDVDALVWDLRDGWGGAQPEYLDIFNDRGPTLTLTEHNGERYFANVKWRKPVAMLINDGSRSGKEILAQGFKDYGMGEVIGTRTTGAVLAGRAFLLPDNSLLLLAVNDVLVDGKKLEGEGVAPTVEVPFALQYAQGADPQLDRAVELLSRTVLN